MATPDLCVEEESRLLEAARSVVQNAYAPYSGFRVGAAILTERGTLYTGCNVENGSYGLTICAERTAIASAVTQEGGTQMRIRAVAVVNERTTYCPPCGACRQVIYEFGENAVIVLQEGDNLKRVSIAELLPGAFQLD
jgi:cytidine deaminase